jgi:quercetin dioxygenase-like cupin family protein
MEIRELRACERFASERMQKINLFETPKFFLDLYCFEPGQAQKLHSHGSNDKVYVVVSGQGSFAVGDQRRRLGPGHAVLAPAGIAHGVDNDGPDRLVVMAFMAPHPEPANLGRSQSS